MPDGFSFKIDDHIPADRFRGKEPSRRSAEERGGLLIDGGRENPHLLCIGGEDHNLRIPFMLALRDRGFRITAAGTGDPAPFAGLDLDYRAFRFERFINPLADKTAIGDLTRLIAEVRPDIVQSFDTKPNLLVPLATRNVSNVLTVRTINGLGQIYSSRSPISLMLRLVLPMLQRAASRSTALTIFQNRDDQTFFERRRMLGKGASRLIPGSGVDIDSFDRALAAGPSRSALRRQLDLEGSEIVITVTRLTRQKGIPTLLEAAALVHEMRPTVRFLLVGPRQGEGSYAVTQAEIDRHAPYVIPLGRRSDIPNLLGLADVFAFPTEYREGVPRVLLEAALADLPIVTTNMPGCTDVVRDGWSGLLVPPSNPRLLAARILDMLDDRRTARVMGVRAGRVVRQEFGLQLTVTRYAEAYATLMSARSPSQAAYHGPVSEISSQEARL
jgi:glycosyltransferase involved in cell wall biosynthesis